MPSPNGPREAPPHLFHPPRNSRFNEFFTKASSILRERISEKVAKTLKKTAISRGQVRALPRGDSTARARRLRRAL